MPESRHQIQTTQSEPGVGFRTDALGPLARMGCSDDSENEKTSSDKMESQSCCDSATDGKDEKNSPGSVAPERTDTLVEEKFGKYFGYLH